MDTVRYYLALLALMTFPPAVLYWFIVHPFVRVWRRVGRLTTYVVLAVMFAAVAYGVFRIRHPLLATDFGTDPMLWLPAAVCYGVAIWIQIRIRRQLTFPVLAGYPELEAGGKGGALLQSGLYDRVRHPRYVAVIMGLIAWALFTNYLAMYLLVPVTALALAAIAWLEERELAERFGEEYEEYRRRVPMFIPRFG